MKILLVCMNVVFCLAQAKLKVSVDVITTSSAKLSWNDKHSEIHYVTTDLTNKSTQVSGEILNSDTITLLELNSDTTYGILLFNKSNPKLWFGTIKTASCPDGWTGLGMKCYHLSESGEEKSWNLANETCLSYPSSTLSHPQSEEEIEFIQNLLAKPPPGGDKKPLFYWIGVHDKNMDDVYTYSDGTLVNASSMWESCSETRYTGSDCVSLATVRDDSTQNCLTYGCSGISAGYVCEYSVPDSPHRVAINSGTTLANISWQPPSRGGKSTFQLYSIKLSSSPSDLPYQRVVEVEGDRNTISIPELTPGNLYFLSITTVHKVQDEDFVEGPVYPKTDFITKPLPPQNVTVHSITPTTAKIEWTAPDHNNSASYFHGLIAKYRPLNEAGEEYTEEIVGRNKSSVLLTGLEPLTQFQATVVTYVEYSASSLAPTVSESPRPEPIIFQTLVSPPLSFTVHYFNSTQISLKWTGALGDIKGYEVTMVPSNNDQQRTEIVSKTVTGLVFRDLVPGEEYKFRIVTQQEDETSNSLELTQRTRPAPVDERRVRVEYHSTYLDITIYKSDSFRVVYDGFNGTITSKDPPETIRFRIANSTSDYYHQKVSGLIPGRAYQTTIRVTSGGVLSTPTILPLADAPLEPPANLRFMSRDERGLRLKWDPAPGDIEHYVITCSPVDEGYHCSNEYSKVSHEEKEFHVTGLAPGALYNFSVVAQQRTMNSEKISLSIRTLPDPPTDAQVVNKSTTSIFLKWRQPDCFRDKYRVKYRPNKGGYNYGQLPNDGFVDILVDETFPVQINKKIDGLIPGTSYELYIETGIVNTWSKPTVVRSPTVPEGIGSLKTAEVGSTWALLSWLPGNGTVEYYQIENLPTFQLKSASEGDKRTIKLEANQTFPSYNLTSLQPASFQTTSVKSISNKLVSTAVYLEYQLRPLPPVDVQVKNVTETSFVVTWKHPPVDPPYNFFTVELKGDEENRYNTTEDESMQFDGLSPGYKYYVSVRTSKHKESFPNTVPVVTYPFQPTNITATRITSTSMELSWKTPVGFSDDFLLKWEPNHGKGSLSRDGAILSGLWPGVEYVIEVSTYSEDRKLLSLSSASLTASTLETEPGPPTNFSVNTRSNSSILVTWKHPEKPNGKLLFYILRCGQLFPNINATHDVFNISSTQLSFEVGGLDPGAGYVFSVGSTNSAGTGNFTKPLLAMTSDSAPGPVDGLHASATSSSSISVMWRPPKHPNGFINMYRVVLLDEDKNSVDETQLFNSMKFPGCLLDDVSDETFLDFLKVFDVEHLLNSIGLLRKKEKSFSSGDILHDNGNELYDYEENQDIFRPFCPVKIDFPDLTPYSSYIIEVTPWTSFEVGSLATTIVVTKQEPPGGPPINIRTTSIYSRNVTLSWDPPSQPNGFLTYTVTLLLDPENVNLKETKKTSTDLFPLQPYTWYGAQVRAASEAGEGPISNITYFHSSEGVPGQVEGFQAEAIGSREVRLKWSSPVLPHGVVIAYRVYAYDVMRGVKMEHIFETGRESITHLIVTSKMTLAKLGSLVKSPINESYEQEIDGLVPFTRYNMSVSAETSAGVGYMTSGSVETHEDIPGSPVTNIIYANFSSTKVNISWSEPEFPNGIITRYIVGILKGGIEKHHTKNQYIVLDKLKKFHQYEVYIWAQTRVGEGPSSNKTLIHTDEDVPGSPPLSVRYENISSSAIQVWWDPPNIPNGHIIHYTVYYVIDGKKFRKMSNSTSIVLDNLHPYGLYKIEVAASTRIGEGPQLSAPLWARTMEGQPATPPYNLTYVNMTSSSINLTWLPPTTPNGIIQHYDVNITQPISSEHKVLQTPNRTPSLLITSLHPYTHYIVIVQSNTKYGNGGQESASLNIWTMEDAPQSPPRYLSYVNLTSSSVNVSWSPPSQPNGVITNYTIVYKKEGGTQEERKIIPGNVHNVTISGLEKYTKYSLVVFGSTVAGDSPPSNLTVLTDEDVPSSPPYDVIYHQLSSTAITLSWKAPMFSNGIIQKYKVFYRNTSRSLSQETSTPFLKLTNLKKYGRYNASVVPFTSKGPGKNKSKTITFETLEDAPSDPPSNVQIDAISSTTFNVSWIPPQRPNGRIQFYTIFYKADSSPASSIQVVGRTSFEVRELLKYTWYSVWLTASTAKGDGNHQSGKARARTLEDVPDLPVAHLTSVATSPFSIDINWRPHLPLTGPTYYHVNITPSGGLKEADIRYTNDTSLNVSSLQPFTAYMTTITPLVRGVDGYGPVRGIEVTTLEDSPGSPVFNLRLLHLTSTSVDLKWDPPHRPNGVITYYSVTIHSVEMRNVTDNLTSGTIVELTSGTIMGLKPFTKYTANVTSYTRIGSGPSSYIEFETHQDTPADWPSQIKVVDVLESSVTVSWNPPMVPNGLITNYLLRYMSNTSSIGSVNVSASITSQNISGLLPYTHYNLTAAASTKVGLGPESPPVEFTTLESVPGSPENMECVAISDNEVGVAWKPPSNPNGILKRYVLTQRAFLSGNSTSIDLPLDMDDYTIDSLTPYTRYVISVQATTAVGTGLPAYCDITTQQGFPTSPIELVTLETTEDSLAIAWQPPEKLNGVLKDYAIVYSPPDGCDANRGIVTQEEIDLCEVTSGRNNTYALRNLQKYVMYLVKVSAATERGSGPFSSPISKRTDSGSPDNPPRHVQALTMSSTSINVTWEEPISLAGVTTYQVQAINQINLKKRSSQLLESHVHAFVMKNLDPNTPYEIAVDAITDHGSISSSAITVKTFEDAPSDWPIDLNLQITNGNSSSAELFFGPPLQPNGRIVLYDIEYKMTENNLTTNITLPASTFNESLHSETNHSWAVHGLLGGRSYTFRMRGSTMVGAGPWSLWTHPVKLPINAPPPPSSPPSIASNIQSEDDVDPITSSTITVSSPCVFSDINGPIMFIAIIVVEVGANLNQKPTEWEQAYPLSPSPPYQIIATYNPQKECPFANAPSNGQNARRRRSVSSLGRGFVIGDDQSCEEAPSGAFCNGPLKSATAYKVKYRAVTENGLVTDTAYSDAIETKPMVQTSHIHIIIAAVGAAILVGVILVFFITFRRRRKRNSSDNTLEADTFSGPSKHRVESESTGRGGMVEGGGFVNKGFAGTPRQDVKVREGSATSRPVSKVKFGSHVARFCLDQHKGFTTEFEEVCALAAEGARPFAQCSKAKNRTADTLPYEQNRVRITTGSEDNTSGYINASFVQGEASSHQYITTQLPLKRTREDFWKMIWEQRASSIVMFCDEDRDHDVYWPEKGTKRFGPFCIRFLDEEKHPNWMVRRFVLSYGETSRDIIQFHFRNWTVLETPGGVKSILQFFQEVRSCVDRVSFPLVVMSRDGSVQCGIFICIDRILDQIPLQSYVDVFATVLDARQHRVNLVENVSEYILIHRCVYETINHEFNAATTPTGDGLEETVF